MNNDTPSQRAPTRHRAKTTAHPTAASPLSSLCAYAGLLAGTTAAVFLAGGPAQGSLGIFLLCTGIVLISCPARVHVGWPLWATTGALVAWGALAFLPAAWFHPSAWRTAMEGASAIHLPDTVTPVPWETAFWLAILLVSCVTGLLMLAHPLRSRSALLFAAAGVVMCGAYAALSIYAKETGWHFPFSGGATFGFFPNRNHTATFLLTGSVVSLGILTVCLRERAWLVAALTATAMIVCVSGLFFFSGSRGGVVFLVVGALIWVAGLGRSHRNVPLTVSVLTLILATGLLFLISGGEARKRLLSAGEQETPAQPASTTEDAPADFRLLIYRDAFKMVKDSPVFGVGLGAFAPAFAEYRDASLSNSTAVHPESDWLMLTAEAGVPALVFALATGMLLALRLRGLADHPYWPLRWGCVAATTAAILHGVVDVPTHRVALGWWILLVAALGFQTGGQSSCKSGLVQRTLFALTGGAALLLGALLVRAEWMGGQPLPPFAAAKERDEILAMFNRHETEAALERARTAVAVSPTAAPLYYQLGTLLLHFEDTDAEADEAFKAQRVLIPVSATVPVDQGVAWISIDQKRTAVLWLEAITRQERVDRTPGTKPATLGLYRSLLSRAAPYPDVQDALFAVASHGPAFLLAWLEMAPDAAVREKLTGIVAQPSLSALFSPEERRRFLCLYYTKGDRAGLARFLDTHADWADSARPLQVRMLADAGQFEQAVRAACAAEGVSTLLPPEARPPTASPDGDDPVTTFYREWTAGDQPRARKALASPLDVGQSAATATEYWRLKLALAIRDQTWAEAWDHLKRYVRTAHPEEGHPEW